MISQHIFISVRYQYVSWNIDVTSNVIDLVQRIQYAKTKSDCLVEAEGIYDPNAKKKKKQEEKGEYKLIGSLLFY